MASPLNFTTIILAGGKSSRMKQEKGLVELLQKPLIEHVIARFKPLTSNFIISSASEMYQYLGYPVIPDIISEIGPMGGIFTCLQASTTELNFVVSCDMPFLDLEVIADLLLESVNYQIVVPHYEDEYYEPLCAIYSKSILSEMALSLEKADYKLPNFFSKVATLKINISQKKWNKVCFFSVNSRVDLQTAMQLLSSKFV